MPSKLLFGTAGIPLSTQQQSSDKGIEQVNKLKLEAMELEFVHGVRMKAENAKALKAIAEKNNVVLTAHGPYYINLNTTEKDKLEASKKRIYDTAHITNCAGGYSIVYHAGFYMGATPEKTYVAIKKAIQDILDLLQQDNNNIWVRPETTGKATQFGSIQELITLSQELDQVLPCIDFAHLYARTIGKVNEKSDFQNIMEDVEKNLGKEAIKNMHIHMSGMNFGPKGEKNHLIMKESKFNYIAVLEVLKEFNAKGVVISESPNIEEDALLMKKYFEGL